MSATDESAIRNVAETISTALASNDEQSTHQLQTLALVHQARLSQLTRNAAAVAAGFGKASPQAAAAEALVSATQATIARIGVVNRQLATPTPAVPSGSWVLHGRVYDEQGVPVGGQTVFLVDKQGAYQREYGFAYTDDTGYFALTAERTPAQEEAAGDSAAAAQPGPELYLEVANERRQPVYLSSKPFQPTVGAATYVNTHLAAGRKPIGDPPRVIRTSAFPTARRSGKARRPSAEAQSNE
jgi:hypothetical protein